MTKRPMDLIAEINRKLTKREQMTLQILLDNGVHAAVKAERKEFEYYAWDSDSMREFGVEMHSIIQWIGLER